MKITTGFEYSDRDLLLVSVFTFLTVSLWVLFEVIKTAKTSTITPTSASIVVPLSPELDIQTLTELGNKKSL